MIMVALSFFNEVKESSLLDRVKFESIEFFEYSSVQAMLNLLVYCESAKVLRNSQKSVFYSSDEAKKIRELKEIRKTNMLGESERVHLNNVSFVPPLS